MENRMVIDRTFCTRNDLEEELYRHFQRSGPIRCLWFDQPNGIGREAIGRLIDKVCAWESIDPCILYQAQAMGPVMHRGVIQRVGDRNLFRRFGFLAVEEGEGLFVIGLEGAAERQLALEPGHVVIFETRPGTYFGFEDGEPSKTLIQFALSKTAPTGSLSAVTATRPARRRSSQTTT